MSEKLEPQTKELIPDHEKVKEVLSLNSDEILITQDGCVKKIIKRHGHGDSPKKGVKCFVHYVGKLEDGSVFDSSRDRKQFHFVLGEGQVIPAWDVALATMKVGELSLIISTSAYAYGKLGCPPRIPADATLTFEIELLRIDNKEMSRPETLQDTINHALKEKEEGNKYWAKGAWRKANKAYNKALAYLTGSHNQESDEEEETSILDEGDEMNTQIIQLKTTLNLNLAATFLKLKQPNKAFISCQKVLEFDNKSVKGHYRMGQAHSDLMEFDLAKQCFFKAKQLDPSLDIQPELEKIKTNLMKYRQKEKEMYAGIFK